MLEMGRPLPQAQGEPARTRHPGLHPACSRNPISMSLGPGGTRRFRKKALREEGLSSRPRDGSAKPKRVLCSSQGTAAEPHARPKPRHLHRRLNSSSGSARREQSPRSVDLSHSHPKSPGERAPRDTGRQPVNTGPQRGPPSWPGSRSWRIQARALLPIRTDRDLPAARVPPHCFSRGSCSPSHTHIHRQPARHTVGAGRKHCRGCTW